MKRGTNSRRSFLRVAAGTLSAAAVLPLQAADGIKVGMIPDSGATQVSIEEKAPLRDYLAKATGSKVELIIPHKLQRNG
jgi:phosphonate transport system substrate-binding protein